MLDDNEVVCREIQISIQLRELNRGNVSRAIGVVIKSSTVGVVDDAVVGILTDARCIHDKCTEGKGAIGTEFRKNAVVQKDQIVADIEVLDPVDIAVPEF